MNRNRYRLIFNRALGKWVPVAEHVKRHRRSATAVLIATAVLAILPLARAEVPLPCAANACSTPSGVVIPGFVGAGEAAYQVNGNQAYINQVGDRSILNWHSFNVSAGHSVQFQQVDSLANGALVPGANFTSLNRIWDINPSVIAGSILQAPGQSANVILVNTNGIAFMGGSQVNLNQFTASSLDIGDKYILNALLTNDSKPQFEGSSGFVKVFEGARITAAKHGRVMLIAPTVVNRGDIEAPDGQIVLAAGSKVYLSAAGNNDKNVRGLLVEVDSPAGLADFDTANGAVKNGVLDGQPVTLINPADDKLGHSINEGSLSTPRGNITMIGYAVNQAGLARATTSVVSNGSIYLLAKDEAVSKTEATRGGRVVLDASSLTEITPDVNDNDVGIDGKDGDGLAQRSRVLALGQTITMEGGARIHAPSGSVEFVALDNPGQFNTSNDPFKTVNAPVSTQARIDIHNGAVIDVAGLRDVAVSAARNTVELELRGDELKDSPVNQQGPLRGQKVYVDVNRALANANAGRETLISTDSLASYQARLGRTVAERSTSGGTIDIRSQGAARIDHGAKLDVSGGSVQYLPAEVKTTLLTSGNEIVDIANASPTRRYDGIATRFERDFERWNVTEVIELGDVFNFDPGYLEGKDAGRVGVIGMGETRFFGQIRGETVIGDLQRNAGTQPRGASLRLGSGDSNDFKLNQNILIGASSVLDDINDLVLDTALFGKGKVENLEIFSNQAAEVRAALRMPARGSVAITAKGVTINNDIEAEGGRIDIKARSNSQDTSQMPRDVVVASGAQLTARGGWTNDFGIGARAAHVAPVDGGTVSLSATGDVRLGAGSRVDVGGGARLKPDGKLVSGNGGSIILEAGANAPATGRHFAEVALGGELLGYALGNGSSLSIQTAKISIGPSSSPGALALDAGFFSRGGFANFQLTGRDGVTLADGVSIAPRVQSLVLRPDAMTLATGGKLSTVADAVMIEDRVRKPANLTLTADGSDFGVVRIGAQARIDGDDAASITLKAGKRIEIEGQITAAAGKVSANLNADPSLNYDPTASIWLGSNAVVDTSGAARIYADNAGLNYGTVLNGGSIKFEANRGYFAAQQGSVLRANGAAPQLLNIANDNGGMGRAVGSDAGRIEISAREGALLDGSLEARAGSPSQRGGSFSLTLGNNVTTSPTGGYPGNERVLLLKPSTSHAAAGLQAGDALPSALEGRGELAADVLEAGGFDRIALKSVDTIRLENGLTLGANRHMPLREIRLDAPRLETAGGDAKVSAHLVRLGNYDPERQQAAAPAVRGTGTFAVSSKALELAGTQTLSGMAHADLSGSDEVRLSGVSTATAPRPAGVLATAADLTLRGARIAPTSYSAFVVDVGSGRVEFNHGGSAATEPLSALGSLTVKARDILQAGNLLVPFGQIDLQATNTLSFAPGSLTSVSASPDRVIPFGRIENGRTWYVESGGLKLAIGALPEKSIRTQAARIDMQPGATINLAGGADLQAYEFTVGPGGSRDVLADGSRYAILPGYANVIGAEDLQEKFDRNGAEAIFLSGVPGLADGVYTLLPAHYALLPGAYAVKLDNNITDLTPQQAHTRQDGVRIAAGYLTDSRVGAPRDARWRGIEVMTHDQVRARSEFTLTRAAEFFADGHNRPQDAGLLSIDTTGSGINALKLDAAFMLGAAPGGRGGQVDISARKLAVTSGTPAGIDPTAVVLDADRLNAMGAESLLIGGTRASDGGTTTLTVGADSMTLANDASHALRAPEVLLAAKDTLTLAAGSTIDAQGPSGHAGHYQTSGNGAFVRAASTSATFSRSGSPDRSQGTLRGEPGSVIRAAHSVIIDATKKNDYDGSIDFRNQGVSVAGSLTVGANRINLGAAPAGSEGLTYSQTELDALSLASLTLASYTSFDLYGGVQVGGLDATGNPALQNLTLQGAGLRGLNNAGQTAALNAQNLTLTNPGAAQSFTASGTGNLAMNADKVVLGAGEKAIHGFGSVTITSNEVVAAAGSGKLDVKAPVTVNTARISGERGSDQALLAAGRLSILQRTANRLLDPVTALGAKWMWQGASLNLDTQVELPSGSAKFIATEGQLTLGANARVDVAGREVQFFDIKKPSWGGSAEFVSESANVEFKTGAEVDVSAAAGSDGGTLIVRAKNGKFNVAQNSIRGHAPADAGGRRGDGARAMIDVNELSSFSSLNTTLNSGGFDGQRNLRVRSADVNIAASDNVRAHDIKITVDNGKLDVAGKLDASGAQAGRIELHAKNDVNIIAGAQLSAVASGTDEDGGDIEIGTRDGKLDLAAGSTIDVAGGTGGEGGTVLLRAPRVGSDVNVTKLKSTIAGARSVALEAVRVYNNVNSLVATGGSGTPLSLATVNTDNNSFASHHAAIKARLGKTGDPLFHLLSGVEIRSLGDLTLAADWNLANSRPGNEPGILTLRAGGHLKLNSHLSDGFSHATPFSSGTTPATLLAGPSWSYRLVGGADSVSADPLATQQGAGDVALAAGKLVRTGTGDIRIAAGRDITLADNKAAIYTAGRAAPALAGFNPPANAQFSIGGGNVLLAAARHITGVASAQLYSNWLFRQGALNSDLSAYTTKPAWWVRFDQFQQGVAALGGGDVAMIAGGGIKNVSASAPTQSRANSSAPDLSAHHRTGGGDVQIEAGGEIQGGQYYADNGELSLRADTLSSGQALGNRKVYTVLALGDASAKVQVRGELNTQAVINPHLVVQSAGTGTSVNVANGSSALWSVFSTYGDASEVSLQSLGGNVDFHNVTSTGTGSVASLPDAYKAPLNFSVSPKYDAKRALAVLPATVRLTAFRGDSLIGGVAGTMRPSPNGTLEVLAAGSVNLLGKITLSDMEAMPDAIRPAGDTSNFLATTLTQHAVRPVHAGDSDPARLYAVSGDVAGSLNALNLDLAKAVVVKAGRDVRDLGIKVQHTGAADVSRIEAGRDVIFTALGDRSRNAYLWVSGPGRLEVTAGRNIDLGTSAGIVSRGNLDNAALPATGADIHLSAGVGASGIDYSAAVARLQARLDSGADDTSLWLARWLTGDPSLNSSSAATAVRALAALDAETKRTRVRAMLFDALRTTGRDSLEREGPYQRNFARGYAALELVFPGIGEANADGRSKHYRGNIDLFASRVLTERGGGIDFLAPGGGVIVGRTNTPAAQLKTDEPGSGIGLTDAGVLGMVTVAGGSIRGAARDDIIVNQSRVLTVGGGDIMLWSSEGDIDAGKGKKSAVTVPPPLTIVDSAGNVTQILQGAASGSGIGALRSRGGVAGDVDLIAPKGIVNAGDAGIRAPKVTIPGACQECTNIEADQKIGTPVADTSAITATTSGATAVGDDMSKTATTLAQDLAEAARQINDLKQSLKPTYISAEVIGYGE